MPDIPQRFLDPHDFRQIQNFYTLDRQEHQFTRRVPLESKLPSRAPASPHGRAVTSPELRAINEPHDDNATSPVQKQRRPGPSLQAPIGPSRPNSSASGSAQRPLRRTSHLADRDLGSSRSASSPPIADDRHLLTPPRRPLVALRQVADPQSEELGGTSSSAAFIAYESTAGTDALEPRSRSRFISRRTASAILYALEEAIRTPNVFTPDLEEENASMADLMTGGLPTVNDGSNRGSSNGRSRAPTTAQYSAPGVRGPRDIMRERQAREARKQAELDARAREREDGMARRTAERRATAASVLEGEATSAADRRSAYRRSSGAPASADDPALALDGNGAAGQRISSGSAMRTRADANAQAFAMNATVAGPMEDMPAAPSMTAGTREEVREQTGEVSTARPRSQRVPQSQAASQAQSRPMSSSQAVDEAPKVPLPPPAQPRRPSSQTRPVTGTIATSRAQAGVSVAPSALQPPRAGGAPDTVRRRDTTTTSSSFPHAFERWETLSSHWEGLTSYWIRRLEANSDEVRREPLSQQMARQITDLSAAGANLFHAVVELQRLRASSERKFQRWFHETKTDQERAAEVRAKTEGLLRQELAKAEESLRAAVSRADKERILADTMVEEKKRELQISKEEARRAWEELGRRTQEELERTRSLREGQPTLVGGVQVVPMTGALSRGGSLNRPVGRDDQFPGPTQSPGGYDERDFDSRSVTDDPFLEAARRRPQDSSLPSRVSGEVSSRPLESHPSTTNGHAPASSTMTVYPGSAPEVPMPPPPSRRTVATAPIPSSLSTITTYPSIPITQSSTTAPFYQHRDSSIHSPEQVGTLNPDTHSIVSRPSEESGRLSEEEEFEIDEQGNYRVDTQGRRILYRRSGGHLSEGSDEGDDDDDDVREDVERERAHAARYGGGYVSTPSAGSPSRAGVGVMAGDGEWSTGPIGPGTATATATAGPVDYNESGYGSGWENLPRHHHHHPTRLSDVLEEEDERSRTSQSRAIETSRPL